MPIHADTCLYHLHQPMRVRTCFDPDYRAIEDDWTLLTLDLNLSSLDRLADALAEAQEEVHGVEDVHLSMSNLKKRTCSWLSLSHAGELGFVNDPSSKELLWQVSGLVQWCGAVVRCGSVVKEWCGSVVKEWCGAVGCGGVVKRGFGTFKSRF